MKRTERLNELRQMELPELDARLKEVRTELFNLRFQAATGQLDNHRQIRSVRRQIAAVLTVMQGRRLGIEDLVAADTAIAPSRAGAATAVAEAETEPGAEPASSETDDTAGAELENETEAAAAEAEPEVEEQVK